MPNPGDLSPIGSPLLLTYPPSAYFLTSPPLANPPKNSSKESYMALVVEIFLEESTSFNLKLS